MKITGVGLNLRFLLWLVSSTVSVLLTGANSDASLEKLLEPALSVAKTLVNTALPPTTPPKIANSIQVSTPIPPYTPPVAPVDNAISVAKTLINTVTPPATPVVSASPATVVSPLKPVSSVSSNSFGSSSLNNKPYHAGPFNNSSVVSKKIDLNQVHSDSNFKDKVTDAWQQISAGDPHAFMNVNPKNSSIYVKGDLQHVIDLENYISSLDKPVVQVRVDAIILFAQRNYNFDIGIDWSGIYNRAQSIISSANPFGFVGLGGSLTEIPKPTSPIDSFYNSSAGVPSTGSSPNNNLFVNPTNFAINLFNKAFSATTNDNSGNSFMQLPFVFGGPDLNLRRLNLVLNVAESESKVKIVSRPSVLTSNAETAVVNIGQQLPMQQSAINANTGSIYKGSQIVYKSVGISLTVTPTVGSDNRTVTLDIKISDLEVISGSTQSSADGIMTNPPVLSDLAVTNKVTLKSGQTTVIGGLAKRTDKLTKNQIPWINRIPLLGNLFKASLSSDVELEQFIFITPTIIEENL